MAIIGFICFVTVLGNFYQAIYDEIIYDDFGTGIGKLSYVLLAVDSRDGRTRVSELRTPKCCPHPSSPGR